MIFCLTQKIKMGLSLSGLQFGFSCCENEMGQLEEQTSMQGRKILFFIKRPENKTDVLLGSSGGYDSLFKGETLQH